jgi:hypothetical protein
MFAGIPTAPQRRKAFTAGFLLEAAGLAVLVSLGLIHPAAMLPEHQYVYISLAPPPPVNPRPAAHSAETTRGAQGETDRKT